MMSNSVCDRKRIPCAPGGTLIWSFGSLLRLLGLPVPPQASLTQPQKYYSAFSLQPPNFKAKTGLCFAFNGAQGCNFRMCKFAHACAGVPLAQEKTVGPLQTVTFLGLEIDSTNCQIRVPQDKVDNLVHQIRVVLSKPKISLVGVQSLVGSLNFLCKAIPHGRSTPIATTLKTLLNSLPQLSLLQCGS